MSSEVQAQDQNLITLATAIVASEKMAPKGFRLSLRTILGISTFAILSTILWALFVSPTKPGAALMIGMRAAEGISRSPGNAPPYADYEIEPIRHTIGSTWAHEIAQKLSSEKMGNPGLSGVLANAHGPEVVNTLQESFSGIHNKCSIRISAEVFDHPNSPYASIMSNIGGREDGFMILLAHEMAHCYWNPGPAFEARLNQATSPDDIKKGVGLMSLVTNMAESYSDAYAVIFSARYDRDLYARAYQSVWNFRAAKATPSNFYNTLNALESAAALAPTLPASNNPLSVRWDVTHRYVLSAALTGSMRWLQGQGVPQDKAIENINEVLLGQGIVFSLRQVAGKDYLIVSQVSVKDQQMTN